MSNYLTENLRTVALVGHGSCGKTSLIEAMLYRTGMISELGSIERGNTMCDNDALEKQVQHSIRLAVAHVDTALPDLTPVRIHVLDTPGYPDYIGQDMSALDAVKSVCAVIDATKGVELLTRRTRRRPRTAASGPAGSLGSGRSPDQPSRQQPLHRHRLLRQGRRRSRHSQRR